jgi:hypothetical protein
MQFILIDGSTVNSADVQLANDNWHFSQISNGRDLTYLLYTRDKNTFPGFDIVTYNNSLSGRPDPGSTSILGTLGNQLLTDPLGAPLDALNSGVKQIFASSGVQTILVAALVVVAVAVFIKESK